MGLQSKTNVAAPLLMYMHCSYHWTVKSELRHGSAKRTGIYNRQFEELFLNLAFIYPPIKWNKVVWINKVKWGSCLQPAWLSHLSRCCPAASSDLCKYISEDLPKKTWNEQKYEWGKKMIHFSDSERCVVWTPCNILHKKEQEEWHSDHNNLWCCVLSFVEVLNTALYMKYR